MAAEKPDKRTSNRRPEESASAQSTRREEIEPSNQIILGESVFMTEGAVTRKTSAKMGLPERIGQFQILRELGRGGMGVVYLAKQPNLNREVALKVLNINLQSDPEDAARFASEAKLAASLQHPNIVQIYEIGEQDGYAFMAMEYVRGGSLHQRLKAGSPTARAAAELVEALARAMHHAHEKGVIHRDLKPGNILISEAGSAAKPTDETLKAPAAGPDGVLTGTPKITDFGLAKNVNQSMHLTATGVALGTPSYMAPEQARDDRKHIGPCSDVYAFGTILYEMLTGRPPFNGSTPLVIMQQVVRAKPVPPSEIRPSVPKELEAICLKCLEKLPKNRYGSALELADALSGFLDGVPVPIVSERPATRRPQLIAAGAALVAIAAIVCAVWFGISASDNDKKRRSAQQNAERYFAENESLRKSAETANRAYFENALVQAALAGDAGDAERATAILKSIVDAHGVIAPELLRAADYNLAEWSSQTVRPIATAQHGARINALQWSPKGDLLASAGDDGRVRFFGANGVEAGKAIECQAAAPGGKRPALSVGWSPRGDRLAVGGRAGQIFLWNTAKREADGNPIKPEDLDAEVWQTTFTRDGKMLIAAAADGSVRLIDLASRQPTADLMPREPAGAQVVIALSPDEEMLAVGGKSGVLRVCTIKDQKPTELRSWKLESEVTAVAFDRNRRWLVAGAQSGSIFLWDRRTDRVVNLPPEAGAVRAIAFGPADEFATAAETGAVRIWDADTRQAIHRPILVGRAANGLAFHPVKRILAIGDETGALRLVELPMAMRLQPAIQAEPGAGQAIVAVAHAKKPDALVSIAYEFPRIWSVDGTPRAKLDRLYALCGSVQPAGGMIAVGGRNGRLHFYLADGQDFLKAVESPMSGDVRVTAFSSDGVELLTIARTTAGRPGDDGINSAWIWKSSDPRSPRQILKKLKSPVLSAVWHPSRKQLVLGCEDGTIVVWDSIEDAQVGAALELGSPVQCVAISGDGKRIAAGGTNGAGRIWSLDDGSATTLSFRHSEMVAGVAFSRDSKFLISASQDRTARFWDTATGWPIGPALRHPDAVHSAAFHADDQFAITGCKDGGIRFWRLPKLADRP